MIFKSDYFGTISMNKEDLARLVTDENGRPIRENYKVINLVLKNIIRTLRKGEVVRLNGFGTFESVKVSDRKYYDINAQNTLVLDEYKRIKFKPSRHVKDQVNGDNS